MSNNKVKTINRKKKKGKDEILLNIIVTVVVVSFSIFVLLPFFMIIGTSFEKETNIQNYGYTFIPKTFDLTAYKTVLGDSQIFKAYGVTIFITVAGTILSMIFTSLMAYPLAQRKLKFSSPITFYVYFTMLFGGGLVPTYLLISKYLNMRDSLWVMIIPVLFSPWNMFMLRSFFKSIPEELPESAYIDGANDFQILAKIILPISKPGLATISLFYALGYWNQWYNALLYIDNKDKVPLQYLIMSIVKNIDALKEMARSTGIPVAALPQFSLRMATTVITIGPIVLLYPFVQKYFTSGLTVGAIKG